MNWIFPMAGRGLRTKQLGRFKQLIDIAGKPMLDWFLRGIRSNFKPDDTFIFIILKENAEECFDYMKQLDSRFLVSILTEIQPGPAKTVQAGLNNLSWKVDFAQPAVVANSDQFIQFDVPEIDRTDGFATIYYNDNAKSSYVKIQDGNIIDFKEKALISNYASSGIYGFGTTQLLLDCIELLIQREIKHNGEYYISSAMKFLCAAERKVVPVKTKVKFDLGSEEGIKEFTKFIKMFK